MGRNKTHAIFLVPIFIYFDSSYQHKNKLFLVGIFHLSTPGSCIFPSYKLQTKKASLKNQVVLFWTSNSFLHFHVFVNYIKSYRYNTEINQIKTKV